MILWLDVMGECPFLASNLPLRRCPITGKGWLLSFESAPSNKQQMVGFKCSFISLFTCLYLVLSVLFYLPRSLASISSFKCCFISPVHLALPLVLSS